MATITLATQYTRRLTCVGVQYSTLGHTVTVDAGTIACSCGLICSHVAAVEKQEAAYRLEAMRRARYSATFDL